MHVMDPVKLIRLQKAVELCGFAVHKVVITADNEDAHYPKVELHLQEKDAPATTTDAIAYDKD